MGTLIALTFLLMLEDPHRFGTQGATVGGYRAVRCGLRSALLGSEAGRAGRKEWKETSDRCDRAQAGDHLWGAEKCTNRCTTTSEWRWRPQPKKHSSKETTKLNMPSSGGCVNRLAQLRSMFSWKAITLVDPKTGRVEPLDSSFYIMLGLREKSGAREWFSTSSVCKKWSLSGQVLNSERMGNSAGKPVAALSQ